VLRIDEHPYFSRIDGDTRCALSTINIYCALVRLALASQRAAALPCLIGNSRGSSHPIHSLYEPHSTASASQASHHLATRRTSSVGMW
jgi:hypothetical protein